MSQFLSYEEIAISTVVKALADLTIPANATHAQLQAKTNTINYTMDGSTAPTATASGVGMQLHVIHPPETFEKADLQNIQFIRGAAADGVLCIHYFGGRDI